MSVTNPNILEEHENILEEKEYLLREKKLALARKNFIHFCQYVVKDECCTPDTIFTTEGGELTADQLTLGTKVLSFENGKYSWNKIISINHYKKQCVDVALESGKTITTSLDHPFLTEKGWTEAQDLRPNRDEVLLACRWEQENELTKFDTLDCYVLGVALGKELSGNFIVAKENIDFIEEWFTERDINFHVSLYNNPKYIAEVSKIVINELWTHNAYTDLFDVIGLHSVNIVEEFIAGLFDSCGDYDTRTKKLCFDFINNNSAIITNKLLQYVGLYGRVVKKFSNMGKLNSVVLNKDENLSFFNLPINSIWYSSKFKFKIDKTTAPGYLKDKVVGVKMSDDDRVIGIEVETTHNHVTNGMITHNSSGNKIKLAELQKTWIRHIAFCKRHNLNALILAPMSSGKTQIISVAMPLYVLGKNPASRILLICLSDEAAKERVTSIKSYIESDPDYHAVFPHIKPGAKQEWTKHKLFIERDTYAKDASINSNGITSSSIIGARCDLLLVDDIFDQRTAVSQPATREQYLTTYRQVCLSRVEPNGSVIAICTRWHELDLAGHIMADPGMMRRYAVLVQRVADDFSGLECEVHVPDKYKFLYQKECGEFFTSKAGY